MKSESTGRRAAVEGGATGTRGDAPPWKAALPGLGATRRRGRRRYRGSGRRMNKVASGQAPIFTPMSASCFSISSAHPRLAAGLAGLGWAMEATTMPEFSTTRRAHSSANFPTPITNRGWNQFTVRRRARSHTSKRGFFLGDLEVVRRAVLSALFHEDQGTVVAHEECFEKPFRGLESLFGPAPEPLSAHLAFLAVEAFHRALFVRGGGRLHRGFDAEPVLDGVDLTERHSGLGHAPGAGVHAQQQHPLRGGREPLQVDVVGAPARSPEDCRRR